MPKMNGMSLIEEIHTRQLPVTVIVTSGHGNVKDAVQTMRLGAFDFLTKTADPQHLCLLVQRALRERELQDEVVAVPHPTPGGPFVPERDQQERTCSTSSSLIGHISSTNSTVLISGETGTGKEQIARDSPGLGAQAVRADDRHKLCGESRNVARKRAIGRKKGSSAGRCWACKRALERHRGRGSG